jgi:hypothetical protein
LIGHVAVGTTAARGWSLGKGGAFMLNILKAQWERLVRPPYIRQIVFEWPDDWRQRDENNKEWPLNIPQDIVSVHPACKSGVGISASMWLPDRALPQIHNGWAYLIETIIDPWDALGAETYQQIATDLERKTCEALAAHSASVWSDIDDPHVPRLTAEIVSRLQPRLLLRRRHAPIIISSTGERSRAASLLRWVPYSAVIGDRPHYRSWVIDDLAADAALTIGQLLTEAVPEAEVGNDNGDISVDAKALAVFFEHPDWTKVQIADHLRCNEKSLAPKRCPKLAAAIAAYKAPCLPRGTKGADGSIEAWDAE